MNGTIDEKFIYRVGPAKLNSSLSVEPASGGEDIACGNWSKHLRKTPPHALGSIQARGGAGLRSGRQDAHLELPLAGARMLGDLLRAEGFAVGRKHMTAPMRRMGIAARDGKGCWFTIPRWSTWR